MGFTFGTVAFLLLAYTSAYYLLEDDDVTVSVIWPDEYYFKAERIDVLAGDVQGFEVWRSSEHNRTHVSYYDGVKEMYYTDETDESYGSVSVIYTKTDKSLDNFVVCEEKSSDSDSSFLPDLTGYTNKVETTLDGKPVTVWRAENAVEGEGKTEKTLCVYRTEYGFDIPIQETEKTYSFAKGDLEEYTQINFKSFEYKVSLQDVTVPKDSECLYEGVLGRHFQSDLKYLQPHLPGHLDKAYFSFRRHHNKIYEKHEQDLRKRIFHKNWKMVLEHNRKNLGYKLELNQFADYTDEEFMMMTGTRPSKGIGEGTIPMDIEMLEEDLPESYDLRLNGHMRPIRNQGGCGSCWAFTTTAVVEGALSVANGGRNLDLSEQSMVDCAWGYGNDGCSGGELDKALQYLVDKGLPTEFEYGPYKHIDGKCHLTNVSDVYKIKGFSKVTPGNPVAMKAALVKYGPLAVAVYAGSKMKSYSSGILYDVECDEVSVNHGVVVVGYGEREGTPYWIIRNSWGETWGEDGYMLISAVNDNCHVMDTAYYIYTKTDKSLDNFVVCEEKSSDSDASFLPDLTGYTNKVETTLDGKPVTVWRAENAVEGEGKTEKTLCVYRTEYGFDIPIQETEKTYSFEKGDLEEYTQINFKSFEYKVSLQDVTVPKDSECLYEGVLGRHFQSDLKYLQPHLPGHLDKAYFSFRRHHNKIYEKHEQDLRKRIFHKNWKMVLEHNRKNLGYKLELNQFADYTDEEFMMMTGTRPSKGIGEGTIPMDIEVLEEDLPESYDLRLNGHMRPIRNQGGCGSCWAFTTTAVVEGALSVANGGRNLDLSEQSMVDCAWGYGNDGCSGGELDKALQYLVDKGLPTEFEYGPYKHIDGKCHLTNVSDVYKIKGFSKVTPGNPVAMKAALVKYGPLAVAVYAGSKMKSYSSGILYDVECDEVSVNHGVVVVGYGEREGTPYWIIRNSWGETWGEDGYMLISAVNDNCHVMDTAYYVVV